MIVLLFLGSGLAGCSGGGGASGTIPAAAARFVQAPATAQAVASASPSTLTISTTPLATATPAPLASAPGVPAAATPASSAAATAPPITVPPATALPATPMPATAMPATAMPATATPATPVPATPVPAVPLPTATPTTIAAIAPPIYPVYSSYFTGKTPFHDTVASLMRAGATVLSSTIASNYWSQGISQNVNPLAGSSGNGPMYNVHTGDPAYAFACPAYGTCNASGMLVHYPVGAAPAPGSDHHLVSFDPIYAHAEVDGWGGNPSNACTLAGGIANCSWGGVFPFSGNGLATDYSGGNAAGYAYGLMNVSAQEVLNGRIDHALGLIGSCLDAGGVYPAQPGRPTDNACPANLEPNAPYGALIHLKASVNIDSFGYSPYCRAIVQALQTYGGYTADTNNGYGIAVEFEYPKNPAYVSDPWYSTIYPSMAAGGDGSGSGSNFRYSTCLQRIPASDIEVIAISPNLP